MSNFRKRFYSSKSISECISGEYQVVTQKLAKLEIA
jgi:hypothetical protein